MVIPRWYHNILRHQRKPYPRYPPSLSEITGPQNKSFASEMQVLCRKTTPVRTCYRWSRNPCRSWENTRNPGLAHPLIQKRITDLYWCCNLPCTIPPTPHYSKRPTLGSAFPKRIWMETPAWRSISTDQDANQIHYRTPPHWLSITLSNLPRHGCFQSWSRSMDRPRTLPREDSPCRIP